MFLYPRKQSFGSRGIKELPYPSVCAKFVPLLYGHVIQSIQTGMGFFVADQDTYIKDVHFA